MRASIYATLYTVLGIIFSLATSAPWIPVLGYSAIAFILALVHFWLLDRFEESMLFWPILIGGFFFGLV